MYPRGSYADPVGDFFKALIFILVLGAVALGLLMLLLYALERGDPGRPGRQAVAMRRRAHAAEFGEPLSGPVMFDEQAIPRLLELRRESRRLRRKEHVMYLVAYLIGAVAAAFMVTDTATLGLSVLAVAIVAGVWAGSLHKTGNEIEARFETVRIRAGHYGEVPELQRWLDWQPASQ